MPYNAVIFDLDGVITDTAKYHYLGWKRLADELGVYFDEQINERLRGVSRMGSLEIVLERSDEAYAEDEKQEMAARKNEYYKEMLRELTPEDVLAGTHELLAALGERDVRTALASASRNAPFVLQRLELTDAFDYVADAGEIANPKPHPEMFLVCAEHLGVAPGECIGVEDAAAGVESIHRAGMFAVGIGNPETVREADVLLTDLTEYDQILKLIDESRGT